MCQRVLTRAFCLMFPFCVCLQEDRFFLVIYEKTKSPEKLAAMVELEGKLINSECEGGIKLHLLTALFTTRLFLSSPPFSLVTWLDCIATCDENAALFKGEPGRFKDTCRA